MIGQLQPAAGTLRKPKFLKIQTGHRNVLWTNKPSVSSIVEQLFLQYWFVYTIIIQTVIETIHYF